MKGKRKGCTSRVNRLGRRHKVADGGKFLGTFCDECPEGDL